MEWYQGGIAEAVTESRKNESIFVVYIEGKDDKSRHVSQTINTPQVADMLNSRHFTAIRVESGSVSHQQFSEIYKQTTSPSIYFIGKTGAPLEIITDASLNPTQMSEKINQILVQNGGQPLQPRQLEEVAKTEEIVTTAAPVMEPTVEVPPNEPHEATAGTSETSLTIEERLRFVRELIIKKRKEKEDEEKEKERVKELERRQLGRDVQEMQRWQQDQELKTMMSEREKERQEDKAARERVKRQIEEDKREKAARLSNLLQQQQQSVAVEQPKIAVRPVNSDTARLQFRLPDGSQITHDFKSSACLQEVIDYLQLNANLRDFILSTTFPKREFTVNDASMNLMDLQLVPNAAVLVLPRARTTVANPPSGGIRGMLWYVLAPIFSLIEYLKSFVWTTNPPRTPSPASDNKRVTSDADKPSSSGSVTRRIPGENKVKKQGNIHRLNDHDSDEDNNTWNGNSTQQM